MEHEYKVGDWVMRPRVTNWMNPNTTPRTVCSRIVKIRDTGHAKLHNDNDRLQPWWDTAWFTPEPFAHWVERVRKENKSK